MPSTKKVPFSTLVGLTLTAINIKTGIENDQITFHTSCGRSFCMGHDQECCEVVSLEPVTNEELAGLLSMPVTQADEEIKDHKHSARSLEESQWTFYRLATNQGYIVFRWFGESNGYYSIGVSFEELFS